MIFNRPQYVLRPAEGRDLSRLSRLLTDPKCIQHRHLDWRTPPDWLGSKPFWALEKKDEFTAALAFPADPPGIFWVRLFAALPTLKLEKAWQLLFQKASEEAFTFIGDKRIVSLAIHPWYEQLLRRNNFKHELDIVVLAWVGPNSSSIQPPPDCRIREMRVEDITEVEQVDRHAFELLWQNTEETLIKAYRDSSYATVLLENDRIIGYQISTGGPLNAHLARIAVLPHHQKQGLGLFILQDMLNHYQARGIGSITVNTQGNNLASISLYLKAGFQRTGEKFPVYLYQIY